MTSHPTDETGPEFSELLLSTSGSLECALTGTALLQNPYFNKGSAFSKEERSEFQLHGLLPPNVQTLDEQARRAYGQYKGKGNDLGKNTFLTSLRDQNEVLFYRVIQDHLKEMFPIIYTPTEGEAIRHFSEIFRKPEGCFLNIQDLDRIEQDLGQWGGPEDIDLVIVSDGEQILGIGDQGVGGILISVAKSVIYTLCAGIHPTRMLPVVLDCGTNNEDLLRDPLYLGLQQKRARGDQYDAFVKEFVRVARKAYPKSYIHFEDFGVTNARRILNEYKPDIPCFNDDIQGTGCVTLAAIMTALHVSKVGFDEARVVVFGAGSAGTGIADQVRDAIAVETGKSKEEAARQIWCIDKPGILLKSQKDELSEAQLHYAREDEEWKGKDAKSLVGIIREVKPHILIGTSTKPKSFTEDVVKEMAKHVERPIILPLSNPTNLHEAVPTDIIEWTEGNALVATGSPFPPVEHNGKSFEIAECNNSTIFPGIGLGVVLSRARLITPELLVAATKALAAQAPALGDPTAALLPDVTDVREISVHVAKAVIQAAVKEGLNGVKDIPTTDRKLEKWIKEQMWDARYRELEKVEPGTASALARGVAGIAT